MWSFDNIDAICASGLGGGSLIYANVLLRKDEKWFVREEPGHGSWRDGYEYWPVTRADLDPHYDRVERMMNVQKYPLDQAPYDKTLKTLAFRDAARSLDLDWDLVNLAVTFANAGDPPMVGEPIKEDRPNIHGRTRLTCKLTGECDLGCNHGSKNSLDYTYITAAWHAGADVRTRHEVRSFEPRDGGGYTVTYVIHDAESEGYATDTSRLDVHTMTCDRLILSAGTLGTTYLMLNNRAAFPHLSPMLGQRFSGNGDLLTFARQCKTEVDGKKVPRVLDGSHAPVITSAIRVPDEADGGAGPRLLPRGRRPAGVRRLDAPAARRAGLVLQAAARPAEARRQLHHAQGHRHRRRDRRGARRLRGVRGLPAAARHGPRHPRGRHAPRGGEAPGRLEEERRLQAVLRARARHLQARRRGDGRHVPRQPDLAAEPRRHRARARRLPDGPRRRRGRRRHLRPRLQLPRPAHRRRLGHARPGRSQPEPHDRRTRRSLRRRDPRGDERTHRDRTPAAPARPRRRGPHAAEQASRLGRVHREDARLHHVRRGRLRQRLPAGQEGEDEVHVPPHDHDGRHRALRRRARAPGHGRGLRRLRRARRQARRSSRAGSTSSSTPTRTARSASS